VGFTERVDSAWPNCERESDMKKSIDFSDKDAEKLKEMASQLDTTETEVVRRAVRLVHWALNKKLLIEDENGVRQVEFLK
jgi:hypothetical protein